MPKMRLSLVVVIGLMVTGIVASMATSSGAEPVGPSPVAVDPVIQEIVPRAYLPILLNRHCPNFFDDFSDPTTGWPVGQHKLVDYGYLEGEYRIYSKSDGYIYAFRAPTCDRQNYVVEVNGRWQGALGSSLGIAFSIAGDFDEYYLYDINTDYRMFRLNYRGPAGWQEIISPVANVAIKGGNASNLLKVVRDGATISLIANGSTLATVSDNRISAPGGAGVAASPYDGQSRADARFDNFSMSWLPNVTPPDSRGAPEPSASLSPPGDFAAVPDLPLWPSTLGQ